MVKDGEIVYPGTELTQSSELPPRKGMFFFPFIVVKVEFGAHTVRKLWFLVTCLHSLPVFIF